MGSFLSSLLGGGPAEADGSSSSPGDSRVQTFHSSARFQLRFNELKDSSRLVNPISFSLDLNSPPPPFFAYLVDLSPSLSLLLRWNCKGGDRFLSVVVRALQIHRAGDSRHGRQVHRRWIHQNRRRRIIRNTPLSLSLSFDFHEWFCFFYLENVFFSGCGGVNNRM